MTAHDSKDVEQGEHSSITGGCGNLDSYYVNQNGSSSESI